MEIIQNTVISFKIKWKEDTETADTGL